MRLLQLSGVVEHIGTIDTLERNCLLQQPVNERVFRDEVLGRAIADSVNEGVQPARVACRDLQSAR